MKKIFTGVRSFDNMLNSPLKEFDVLKVIQISETFIPSDVLERISGYEVFTDTDEEIDDKIYSTVSLHNIITDKGDDRTNENTRLRVEALYKKIANFPYFMVTKI